MMFGTVARITVKAGKDEAMLAFIKDWTQTSGRLAGQVAEYVFQLDDQPGSYLAIGIFPSREAYYRYASDPETDRWYRSWRELLEADPEWNDGAVVHSDVLARL